jgi:hypothetical protein
LFDAVVSLSDAVIFVAIRPRRAHTPSPPPPQAAVLRIHGGTRDKPGTTDPCLFRTRRLRRWEGWSRFRRPHRVASSRADHRIECLPAGCCSVALRWFVWAARGSIRTPAGRPAETALLLARASRWRDQPGPCMRMWRRRTLRRVREADAKPAETPPVRPQRNSPRPGGELNAKEFTAAARGEGIRRSEDSAGQPRGTRVVSLLPCGMHARVRSLRR